jgi:hypothetical protein
MLLAPMLPPLSAVAISQSVVLNGQIQTGDVLANQTLNVVDVSGATAVVGTATGNSLLVGTEVGSLSVQPAQPAQPLQTMSGDTTAINQLTIDTHAGGPTTMLAAATANTAEADVSGGGTLSGTFTQLSNGGQVTSTNDFSATSAAPSDPVVVVSDVSATSQAIANSMSLGVTGSLANVQIDQTNSATVDAISGSSPNYGALLQDTAGTASFNAIAVNNNITIAGAPSTTTGASEYVVTAQTVSGGQTLAGQIVNAGDAQTLAGEATATGNNISASNQGGDLNLTSAQTNAAYTQADSVVTAYAFGSASVTGSGVGNSVMAANYGVSTELSNTQVNDGEVDGSASFTGGATDPTQPSYDLTASSSAVGNAATAFACTDCGGVITIASSQTNTNTIDATTQVDMTGDNRSITSTATAIGNNASFYVSKSSK